MSEKSNLYEIQNNTLYFDGVNLIEKIALKYGTPTYVFSENEIKRNLVRMKKAFSAHYPQTEIAYSTKNNMIYDICSIISNEVNYFETTSLKELMLVEKLAQNNSKPLNLISTNLYKPAGLVEKLIDFGEVIPEKEIGSRMSSLIAIDSYQDMKNIEKVAKKLNKKARVLIRVNPGIQMSRETTVFASAYPDAKCSVIIKDIDSIRELSKNDSIDKWLLNRTYNPEFDFAERVVQEAEDSEYLELLGLHGHLGSQVTNIDYFHHFFEVISLFYKLMEEKIGRKLTFLDLGGGYPVKYHKKEKVPSINDIAKSLSENISRANISPELIIESGRYITASSGLLLSQVNLTKENPSGGKIAVMDTSVYSDLLDVIAAKWKFEIILANNVSENKEPTKFNNWDIVGATNDTLDQLTPIIQTNDEAANRCIFSRELARKDYLAIKNAGAYTTCFNSNYCGKSKPIILLIDKNNDIHLLNRNYW